MIPIFPWGSWRSKGVPSGTGDFLRLLLGELGTPKLAQIFTYGKWLYPYIWYTGRHIWTKDVWKHAILRMNVLSHQISSHLPPKSPQNPIFWGPFNAKPIIQRALRQSHVNGGTTLKLYGYIGIGKYWGVCQNISARGTWGHRAP